MCVRLVQCVWGGGNAWVIVCVESGGYLCANVYVYMRVCGCVTPTDVCLIQHLTKDESKHTKHFSLLFFLQMCVCVCV